MCACVCFQSALNFKNGNFFTVLVDSVSSQVLYMKTVIGTQQLDNIISIQPLSHRQVRGIVSQGHVRQRGQTVTGMGEGSDRSRHGSGTATVERLLRDMCGGGIFWGQVWRRGLSGTGVAQVSVRDRNGEGLSGTDTGRVQSGTGMGEGEVRDRHGWVSQGQIWRGIRQREV